MHHLRIQPSEVEALPYYEYFYIVRELSDMLKEQQKGQKQQEEDFQEQKSSFKQPQMPKMPNMGSMSGGFKAPTMPSVKMPKL